ncbi:putative bifunctional diguanylate cyclase/phosphodiesterase [Mangrovicella endophytica]|uniref:putative bifunctional diguanylate cyclase/phosphodiesterase n=1 Tax=Mangrovicella endophytica TaxID=2066697 RepID=UPI000C9DC343|nr:EAL domain-containing protein [Mangrovicella endophytica]
MIIRRQALQRPQSASRLPPLGGSIEVLMSEQPNYASSTALQRRRPLWFTSKPLRPVFVLIGLSTIVATNQAANGQSAIVLSVLVGMVSLVGSTLILRKAEAGSRTRKPVVLHRSGERSTTDEDIELAEDLAEAIANGSLTLHYQPVIDLSRGKVTGAEALVRWRHPRLGMVPPCRFVPLAERVGLIQPLGDWVIATALEQLTRWSKAGLDDLSLSINVSAKQLVQPDFCATTREHLARHAVDPSRIEIELTETAEIEDLPAIAALLSSLKESGVRLALDDFGQGFASMSCLKELPFDKLKLDCDFVAGVDRQGKLQAICSSLIQLGERLGLEVQAEGVETRRELAFLRKAGCRLIQGYYFSRPVPAAEFIAHKEAIEARFGASRQKLQNGLRRIMTLQPQRG